MKRYCKHCETYKNTDNFKPKRSRCKECISKRKAKYREDKISKGIKRKRQSRNENM